MAQESPVPGLYVHIPFCASRCEYCDFFSVTDTGLMAGFMQALLGEIDACRGEFREFDTVYLGGGTPSLLPLQQLERIMDKIRRVFGILPGAEITIEVNPADWRREELFAVRDLGINRISIGIQSFDEKELALLGRRHGREQALRTLEDAAASGFDNLGLDLIYGLPGQEYRQWQASLVQALAFEPAHVSCYELELKPRTPLGRRYEQGEFPVRTEASLRDFFMKTSEFLEGSGYIHYEVSNFARGKGRASRHNRKYWDHTPYLGLGPSAHSFRDGRRWWNHESIGDYIRDLENGKCPVSGREELTAEQLALEALFLGLRTSRGIHLEQYCSRYGTDLLAEKGPLLEDLGRAGLIVIERGSIRPTRAGMAVADSLALL